MKNDRELGFFELYQFSVILQKIRLAGALKILNIVFNFNIKLYLISILNKVNVTM